MMGTPLDAGEYFPDRPPTWSEVLATGLIGALTLSEFVLEDSVVSWPAFGTGFVALGIFAVAANTALGERADAWIAALGLGGKAILLGVAVVAVAAISTVIVEDLVAGGLAAIVLYYLAHLVLAGDVSGWWASRL